MNKTNRSAARHGTAFRALMLGASLLAMDRASKGSSAATTAPCTNVEDMAAKRPPLQAEAGVRQADAAPGARP